MAQAGVFAATSWIGRAIALSRTVRELSGRGFPRTMSNETRRGIVTKINDERKSLMSMAHRELGLGSSDHEPA